MKVLAKILVVILIIFLCIFVIGSIFVALRGKSLVTGAIEKELKRKTTIEKISLGFPLAINIKELDIQDLAHIGYLSIRPSLLGIFSGRVVLNNVTVLKPQILLKRSQDGSLNLPQKKEGKQPQVIVVSLNIKEGKVTFVDQKIDPQGFNILVENINADVHKRLFPVHPVKIDFKIDADIPGRSSVAKAALAGWVDITHKDMDAKFNIKDINAVHYQLYFKKFAPSPLESGMIDLTSDMKAQNNDLKIDSHVESRDLAFVKEEPKPETAEAEVIKPVEDLIFGVPLNLFKNAKGKIVIDFVSMGTLIPFKISRTKLKANFFETAVKNILREPQKILENVLTTEPGEAKKDIKEIGEDFKKIGEQFKNIFKSKPEETTSDTTQ